MRNIFGNGRYANVTATIALVAALGGTSYAATTIGSSNIRNHSIKNVDLATSSVTSGTVKNGSLLAKDFKAGQIPAGARGAAGANGANGAVGATGATGASGVASITSRNGAATSVANGATGSADMSCLPGEKATGGGSSISGGSGWSIVESYPTPNASTPTGWHVVASNNSGSTNNLAAIVVCAS